MIEASIHPDIAVPCGCILGEAPIWDARKGVLYWVDINGETLWCWRPGFEAATSRPVGERVGFVLLTPDPDIVMLGLKSGLARFSLVTGASTSVLAPEPDRPGNRLNDAGVGTDGSIYFGSMNDTERMPTGSFYRWSSSGLVRFGEHAIVTNGPTIDGPNRLLYAANTSDGFVYRHRLGPDGVPGPREDFVTFARQDGHPDGITVDQEGHVWICHFRGARVTRFAPDGTISRVVPLPTPQVTKIAFGGDDLKTVFVTTAARDRDRATDPVAGHLFTFRSEVPGLPAEMCRMGGA